MVKSHRGHDVDNGGSGLCRRLVDDKYRAFSALGAGDDHILDETKSLELCGLGSKSRVVDIRQRLAASTQSGGEIRLWRGS